MYSFVLFKCFFDARLQDDALLVRLESPLCTTVRTQTLQQDALMSSIPPEKITGELTAR